MAKRRPKIGDVFSIDLGNGWYGYGISTSSSDALFVNHFSTVATPALEDILAADALFRVVVNSSAYGSKGWGIVGKIDLPKKWAEPVDYWNRPIGQDQFFIVTANGMKPASREEVSGLEVAAAWYAPHIEERLRANQKGEVSQQEVWSRNPDLMPR